MVVVVVMAMVVGCGGGCHGWWVFWVFVLFFFTGLAMLIFLGFVLFYFTGFNGHSGVVVVQ